MISAAFLNQGWVKTIHQYEQYYQECIDNLRAVWVAEWSGEFAGYVCVKWFSDYAPFSQRDIPEISDFNVLKKYQRLGIGTALMDRVEEEIKKVSSMAGIGVGLYPDYGPAQILYVKRGYIPDGAGMFHEGVPTDLGRQIVVSDGTILYLTKHL